jgi:exodeoxyribonuclease VII small subunit
MSPRERERPPEEAVEGPEEAGFDAQLERLEAIVVELEAGGLGLERSIERYREGVRLLASCRETLGGYRRQVEELTRDAERSLQPYPEDPDAGGESPRP